MQGLRTELATQGFSLCRRRRPAAARPANSPRINAKRLTGPDDPDRDRQFVNIRESIDIFRELGLPIISVDGKKKELNSNFKNAGVVWCHEPEEVNVYDFLSAPSAGPPLTGSTACWPAGSRLRRHLVGHPAFAVEAIGWWWSRYG